MLRVLRVLLRVRAHPRWSRPRPPSRVIRSSLCLLPRPSSHLARPSPVGWTPLHPVSLSLGRPHSSHPLQLSRVTRSRLVLLPPPQSSSHLARTSSRLPPCPCPVLTSLERLPLSRPLLLNLVIRSPHATLLPFHPVSPRLLLLLLLPPPLPLPLPLLLPLSLSLHLVPPSPKHHPPLSHPPPPSPPTHSPSVHWAPPIRTLRSLMHLQRLWTSRIQRQLCRLFHPLLCWVTPCQHLLRPARRPQQQRRPECLLPLPPPRSLRLSSSDLPQKKPLCSHLSPAHPPKSKVGRNRLLPSAPQQPQQQHQQHQQQHQQQQLKTGNPHAPALPLRQPAPCCTLQLMHLSHHPSAANSSTLTLSLDTTPNPTALLGEQ